MVGVTAQPGSEMGLPQATSMKWRTDGSQDNEAAALKQRKIWDAIFLARANRPAKETSP
jgi:hypothetical protein